MYKKFGLFGNYWDYTKSKKIDKGRIEITKNEADHYFFKAPSLRNIEKTGPYFHDGSVFDMMQAVKIMGMDLTDAEIHNIINFLNSLTGEVPQEYKL